MRNQCDSPRGEAGQTLLEVLLAFGVAVLVLSSIVSGVTSSLVNSQYTKNQNLANYYAQQGMEVVRKIRDSGWASFYTDTNLNPSRCINEGSAVLDSLDVSKSNCGSIPMPNIKKIFRRELNFNSISPECPNGSRATVTVSWTDSKCSSGANIFCHNVTLISCFYDINQKQPI